MQVYNAPNSSFVTVLCFYFGSSESTRARFARLWLDRGASALTVSVGASEPNSRTVHPESFSVLKRRSQKVVEELARLELDHKPLIFHLFCDAGMTMWLFMMDYLKDPRVRLFFSSEAVYSHLCSVISVSYASPKLSLRASRKISSDTF